MIRMTRIGNVALGLTFALTGALANVAPTLAGGGQGAITPNSYCSPYYYYDITAYSARHMPYSGAIFKDGPGPLTVQVSVTTSGTVSFTGTVSGGATIGGIVAQAKVEVSASSTQSAQMTVGHTVTKSVGTGLYLHSEYGSWGNNASWQYRHQDQGCYTTLISSGIANIPTTSVGWRFYTTTY